MKLSNEIRFYVVQDSRQKNDLLVKIYIRFFYGKVKKDFFTNIRWPKDRFDKINELLLPRYPYDPDVKFSKERKLEISFVLRKKLVNN